MSEQISKDAFLNLLTSIHTQLEGDEQATRWWYNYHCKKAETDKSSDFTALALEMYLKFGTNFEAAWDWVNSINSVSRWESALAKTM